MKPLSQHHAPPKFRKLIDAVAARDREWFQRHPNATNYERDAIPGEFYPFASDTIARVRVDRLSHSKRTRTPIVESGFLMVLPAALKGGAS